MLLLLAYNITNPVERLNHIPPEIRSTFFKATRDIEYTRLVDIQAKYAEDGGMRFEFTIEMPDSSTSMVVIHMMRDQSVRIEGVTKLSGAIPKNDL